MRILSTPLKLPLPKLLLTFLICSFFILFPTFYLLKSSFDTSLEHNKPWASGGLQSGTTIQRNREVVMGDIIMSKLTNETVKAEVGRASWKLLHTMAARFPLKPTPSEREAYSSFLYLFSRLYPCGECALHFQALLKKFPPQTSSRTTASVHLCHLHNLVNERLGKGEFDCGKGLEGLYDCGCGEEVVVTTAGEGEKKKVKGLELVADIHAQGGEVIDRDEPILKKKGPSNNKFGRGDDVVLEAEEAEEESLGERRDPVTGEKLMEG